MANSHQSPWHKLVVIGGIGVELATCVLLGVFGGRWIDRIFGTEPIFLVVGILVGIAAGIVLLIETTKRFLGE